MGNYENPSVCTGWGGRTYATALLTVVAAVVERRHSVVVSCNTKKENKIKVRTLTCKDCQQSKRYQSSRIVPGFANGSRAGFSSPDGPKTKKQIWRDDGSAYLEALGVLGAHRFRQILKQNDEITCKVAQWRGNRKFECRRVPIRETTRASRGRACRTRSPTQQAVMRNNGTHGRRKGQATVPGTQESFIEFGM